MTLKKSRHARYVERMTQDPNGPRMRRLDVLIDRGIYERLHVLIDQRSSTRRDVIQQLIEDESLRVELAAVGQCEAPKASV
ncbi:MAG TPA: hypothetical protein VFQ95_00260 [Rhodanobacteraceae bacterium]|nr:hypothetical protein [Rhodanobacteraceae bacterium]